MDAVEFAYVASYAGNSNFSETDEGEASGDIKNE